MTRTIEDGATQDEARIPLAEERIRLGVDKVETGRVRVKTTVDERKVFVRQTLERSDVQIERVLIDRMVDVAPEIRQEGDLLIIPVVEEVIVAEKRLVLKEELRIRTVRTRDEVEAPVTLRSVRAEIERDASR